MRVTLDGKQQRDISFDLGQYGAVEYGYAATVHKAQGTTVDGVFVLATPGMDRHLAYVGMTRHCEEARLYAGNDDFRNFEELKERLSRTRPKDSTLDYAQRRGFEVTGKAARKDTDREANLQNDPDRDPIERFKRAQHEFTKVAGKFDLDPGAKQRAAELRQEMKSAAQEISKSRGLMLEAERAGVADQAKSLARENRSRLSKEKDFEMER